ncbi:structural maintenance of chromosomes protein 3-like isoform X2 [Rhodnius prolixus]
MKKIVNSLENAKYRFDMAKDIVSYMDTSKSTLLQEVNKLDKYKELSQKKNSLLMLLHQKLILKWKANISELQNLLENTNSHASTSHQFNSAIAALKISLNEVKVIMVNYLLIKEDILKELNILLAKKEKISLSIDEVNKNIEFVKNKIKEQTLDDLNTEIHLKIEHLYELEERYRNEKCKLQELEEQLYSANQTRLDLISNETRTFTSEKERNLWIENQISTIQVQIHENDTKSTKLLEEKNELIEKRFNLETFFMELDDSHDSETLANKEAETKCQYAYLMNALNDVRHALCEIENSIKMVKNNLDIMKGKLRVKIGRATHDGCESVDKVIAKWQGSDDENYHNLFKGYHGLVIDNFVCDDKLNVAVEAAIGNRLFQHIVDSSRTGNAILKEMNSMQLPGEVWFLPLDKINKPILQYPQDENVRPLIDVIKFSENIEKAMKFIFGKILICKDLEIAVHVARLYRFTCVTLDGDKVKNSGVLSGGFNEQKSSLRSLYVKICKTVEQSNLLNMDLLRHKKTSQDIQMKLDRLHSEIQRFKTENVLYSKKPEAHLKEKIASINNEIELVEKRMETVKLNNLKLKTRQTNLMNERNQIFGTRSPKDEIQLIKMNKLIEEFEKKINVLNNKLLELDFEKKKLNDDIIYKKNIRSLKNAEHNDLNTYERKRNDLLTKEKLIVARMQTLNEKLKWTDQKIIKAEEENDKKIKDLEKLKQLKLDMQTDKQFMQKEKLREKIRYFYLKIKESENYIVSLYEKKYSKLILSRFEDKSLLMVNEELKATSASIKCLGQVYILAKRKYVEAMNFRKKSLRIEQQYSDFTLAYVMVMSFINWLESHVEHKIGEICKCYNHYFSNLVSNGSSSLVYYNNNTEGSETQDLIAFGNNYGLGLTVRFSGDREELGVNTLSKGEQTIILISIIFALLKTQKFPLCLFDEIDGHLSKEQHLQFIRIVGGMSNVQFLISSHHENMIRYGHKIWQISYESLKSRMKSIEFNKAQEVLQKIQYRQEESYSLSSGNSSFSQTDTY